VHEQHRVPAPWTSTLSSTPLAVTSMRPSSPVRRLRPSTSSLAGAPDGFNAYMTSLSLPVATSKTKPRIDSWRGMKRAGLNAGDRLAHVLVQVGECSGGPCGLDAGLVLDRALELVVGEREHAAVGVVDEDDLRRAEQPLADREATRISSSVTTPPALRITCESPSFRPRIAYTLSRASMHATTAVPWPAAVGSGPRTDRHKRRCCAGTRRSRSSGPPSDRGWESPGLSEPTAISP